MNIQKTKYLAGLLTGIFVLFLTGTLFAETTIRIEAVPSTVDINSFIQLSVEIRTSEDAVDINYNSLYDDFIIVGQNTYYQTQITNIDGEYVRSNIRKWQFSLKPTDTGTFVIENIYAIVNGEQIASNSITINVTDSYQNPAPAQPQNHQRNQMPDPGNNSQQNVNPEPVEENPEPQYNLNTTERSFSQDVRNMMQQGDIVIFFTLDKDAYYQGEMAVLSLWAYRERDSGITIPGNDLHEIYSRMNQNLPEDLWLKELDVSNHPVENIRLFDKNWQKYLIIRSLIFPTSAGDYNIGPFAYNYTNYQVRRMGMVLMNQPFQDTRHTNRIIIHVNPIPEQGKPADFSGLVGTYDISAAINTNRVKVNDRVNLSLTIEGVGYLELMNTPQIMNPDNSFIVHNPGALESDYKETTNYYRDYKITKVIEYPITLKKQGDVEIAILPISYFDPRDETYKELSIDPISLTVMPDDAVAIPMNIRIDSEDERHFYLNPRDELPVKFKTTDSLLLSEYPYLLGYFGFMMALFGFTYIVYRRRRKLVSDEYYARATKAFKSARNSLNKTLKHADNLGIKESYKLIEKIILSYLADKLGLSAGNIIKEDVFLKLRNLNINEQYLKQLNELLEKAGRISYAPASIDMEELKSDIDISKVVLKYLDEKIFIK